MFEVETQCHGVKENEAPFVYKGMATLMQKDLVTWNEK